MKKYFLTLAIACAATMMFAQEQEGSKNAPVITFEERFYDNGSVVYDYGDIEKGSDGLCYFVFSNTGKEPLIIEKATSSCGCTVPNPPLYPILPGQKDSISVKYNTNNVGVIGKTVTIISNATNSNQQMRIKGKVVDKKSESGNVGAAPKAIISTEK